MSRLPSMHIYTYNYRIEVYDVSLSSYDVPLSNMMEL